MQRHERLVNAFDVGLGPVTAVRLPPAPRHKRQVKQGADVVPLVNTHRAAGLRLGHLDAVPGERPHERDHRRARTEIHRLSLG